MRRFLCGRIGACEPRQRRARIACRGPLGFPGGLAWLTAVAIVVPWAAETAAQAAGLTVAEARRLVADREMLELNLAAVERLEPDVAGVLAEFPLVVNLSGLRDLAPDVASALAACPGMLDLSGVAALTPQAAAALAGCPGIVDLSGLRSMTEETARALGGYRGRQLRLSVGSLGPDFHLGPLTEQLAPAAIEWRDAGAVARRLDRLDADTARALAEFKGQSLSLDGLTSLDADTARTLAEFKGGHLSLHGLTTIDVATARALVTFKGAQLSLDGLTAIDVATARALAEFKDGWIFSRVTTLDADIAKVLAALNRWDGNLSKLTTLDAETAKALAEFKGQRLSLNGLTTLDAATAKALAEYGGRVSLQDNVQKSFFEKNPLTPETALAWAVVSNGQLPAIAAFESPDSVAIAKALATRKGPLSLPNLKKISPKTLSALLEKQDIDIPLIETLELIPEPDGSPTDDFVIPERFQQR